MKIRGFEEDEGFWEVGLHFFLLLLIGLPLAFLTEFLARLANVQDRGGAFLGLLVGLALGDHIIGRLWRGFGRTPVMPEPNRFWTLVGALPLGLAFMALFGYLTAQLDGGMGFFGIFGLLAGEPIAHRIFNGLRGTRDRALADDEEPETEEVM